MYGIRVKICGITSIEDALAAVDAGADALGFVLHRTSPRAVTPERIRTIVRELPPFVIPVGVFVNEPVETVREMMEACGLMLAQLHGDESAAYCEALGRPALRGIRLRDRDSVSAIAGYRSCTSVRGFVVDAFSDEGYGGTGRLANWSLAAEAARHAPVLLAGGLTPENVEEAVQTVHPYGVDVSSGVEAGPGKKDHEKLRAFVRAAKLVPRRSGGYTSEVRS